VFGIRRESGLDRRKAAYILSKTLENISRGLKFNVSACGRAHKFRNELYGSILLDNI
jgi:hypothetical protein